MRIIYTLSIILLLTNEVKSQERTTPNPAGDPITKIIRFYPNPATSFITFDFQRGYDKSYTLQIFNLPGKKYMRSAILHPRP
ncbi:hypothetical protein [Paraflavitalea speifideaquila]|uniref:hypothetical protein n=1 Tax=Paraflavitalea speifideaquila TaxID=3076558 RepID=UPI0028ED65BE|nr:hypothetical protein [Paraflavitalea speifideiaquila]